MISIEATRGSTSPIHSFAQRLTAAEAIPPLAITGVIAMALAIGVSAGPMTYGHDFLDAALLALAAMWSVGRLVRYLHAPKLATGLEAVALFLLVGGLTALVSAVLATSARPYGDAIFIAMDARLFPGVSWPRLIMGLQPYGRLLLGLAYAYASLGWQPFVLIVALCLSGKEKVVWKFLTAWALALAMSLAIFPWWPAMGGYAHYAITPEMVPAIRVHSAWAYPALLADLRSGHVHELNALTLAGIIAMPSFHSAASVLLGWGFSNLRWLRVPFAILNMAMLVSAVPMGGHYLVDVLAGAIVAGVSIIAAEGLCMTTEERLSMAARWRLARSVPWSAQPIRADPDRAYE